MKRKLQAPAHSEYEQQLCAESIINKLCIVQKQAREERRKLRQGGNDPNILAREENISSEKSELIFLLVRPLLLNQLFKYLYFKLKIRDYEYLSQLDISVIESNLWLLFNRCLKKYQPKFISKGREVKFTTYLSGALKKNYWKYLKSENITKDTSMQRNHIPTVSLEGTIESDGDNDDILTLWAMIKKLLPRRSYFILFHRLVEESTLESIADMLGICKERVRQIEVKAINTLRKHLKDTAIEMGIEAQ